MVLGELDKGGPSNQGGHPSAKIYALNHGYQQQGRRDDGKGELKEDHRAQVQLALSPRLIPIGETTLLQATDEGCKGSTDWFKDEAGAKHHPEHRR